MVRSGRSGLVDDPVGGGDSLADSGFVFEGEVEYEALLVLESRRLSVGGGDVGAVGGLGGSFEEAMGFGIELGEDILFDLQIGQGNRRGGEECRVGSRKCKRKEVLLDKSWPA